MNPNYTDTFVFTNDFAALLPDTPLTSSSQHGLLRAEPVHGTCRVICFSPRHDLTLAEMSLLQIRKVIDVWAEQVLDLGTRFRWVQLFENKGAAMGCSNPHPHGQVWAGNWLPLLAEREDACQRQHWQQYGHSLLRDYLEEELNHHSRIIETNPHWTLLVPYWAIWPFELLLIPRRPIQRLPELTPVERRALADILRRGLIRQDNLFKTSFPYSMGWHGAPTDDGDYPHWHLHAHFYPPLLRSATVRKFMVGYELLAEPQRDFTPEQAAQRLRMVPEVHYKQKD
jgi:UDPglucose--hexose-1-phosphate uridylyltransferase